MEFRCRPVEQQDFASVCGFPQNEDELFFLFPRASYPLTPLQLREAVDQRSDSTVVERDGEVVAFANFYRWETGGCCAVGNVVVAPAARGCGAGRFLIEHMINLAVAKHRAIEVRASCFNANVRGLLFYRSLGFTPFALEERRDGKDRRVALIHLRLGCSPGQPSVQRPLLPWKGGEFMLTMLLSARVVWK